MRQSNRFENNFERPDKIMAIHSPESMKILQKIIELIDMLFQAY